MSGAIGLDVRVGNFTEKSGGLLCGLGLRYP